MMKGIIFLWNLLVSLQRYFLIVGGCVITVLIFTEVMLRYVFVSPLFGIEELIVFIAMWLYFIGASLGAYERSHIKADVIHIWVKKPRSMAIVHTINSVITVALSAILVSWCYHYFLFGIEKGGQTPALRLPVVLSQSAVFAGAILMTIYFFVELVENVRNAISKKPTVEAQSPQGS
jgi:TRAP-type C4-dicarboxylate transport system permease small subunit